jgi:hypothetical protein
MTNDILTEEELCEITGHKTREGLKAWLQQHNIVFLIARSGWPRVHRKALERAMGVTQQTDATVAPVEFNFEALK